MHILNGIDIQTAARGLREEGVRIGSRKLRDQLVELDAIEKTTFGYAAKPHYTQRGLLRTVVTETGQQIKKIYTVALVTGDGFTWLKEILTTTDTEH